ncbi:TonB-dependent receptor [Duganella sp. FT80W]|uniref:TonB-dependent receptor n=1 Tax=Duganella guangzhouensis TaxID=2666084 RepID=A0A6I2L9D8_9BURK|nr:TonB-dependent receptor [Duganella guangzhouensis]MRW92889.1 TonB-dependent receptor [Duganella guangzhouensis]
MKLRMKSMPDAILQVIASGAFTVAAITPAMAQQAAGSEPVQKVVVTGSLISRTDTETATPVQVLTAQDIQRSGKTSVAELLSDLAANGAGTLGTGFSGAFANGASGVSLRGLTVGATLVLVDGHRLAPYPLSDDSQRSFVDVSSIPFDAIDSIEILKSGASSIYGSDAIAGVVNIKLKKNLNGTRVSAEGGDTQHGGGKTKRASISTGFGDLDADGYNAFITAEWRRQDAIKVSDRDSNDWANRDWRSRGGNNLTLGAPVAGLDASGKPRSINSFLTAASTPFLYTPGTGTTSNAANFQFLDSSCNYTKYMANGCTVRDTVSNIQPQSENINVLAGFTKKLGGDWELNAKASLFQRNSINNRGMGAIYSPISFAGNTTLVNGVLTAGVNRIASTTFAQGAVVGSGVTNGLAGAARLYGYIPGVDPTNTLDNTSKTTRFAADVHGTAYGWDVNAGAGITEVKTDIDYSGYIDRPALYAALANGTFNVLGGNDPSVLAKISPRFSNSLDSKLNYLDAVASRELLQWGAGPVALAVGAHWHKREQNSPPAGPTLTGQVASTSAFVIGDETNTAIFSELQATPIKDLELHLSGRYDHYDTYGHSFTPAASFKWAPTKQIGFRGTFAKGFRAPNPAEVGNAGSFFTFNAIPDPILCPDGNQNTKGNVPSQCAINPPYVQTTNKDLKPEKSKSYTFGVIVEPVKGLNATLDYYYIEVNDQIVTAAGNLPGFVPTFVRVPATQMDISNGDGTTSVGTPSVGTAAYAISPYINGGTTKTDGLEADIGYRWRLGDLGTIRANLSATHILSYKTIAVDGTTYELAGTQGPSSVSGATGNPKDRAQLTLGYARGPWDLNATINYTSSFSTLDESVGATSCDSTGLDAGGRTYFQGKVQPAQYCRVSSFTTTNLNLQYKVNQNLTLRAAILNLFDKQPPIDVGTYGNAGAQTSYNASLHQAGAIGRFFSVGAAYQF